MTGIAIVVGLVVAGAAFYFWLQHSQQQRRREIAAAGFTPAQSAWVSKNWAFWDRLPNDLRAEVEGMALVFLDEKVFEPCGGLEKVTDEMRFAVAAQACLLWANQRGVPYPALKAILIYPSAYRVPDKYGIESVRLGESWSRGSVVLAWDSVSNGGRNGEDGHNLVMHEFAHQLDTVNGAADGFPELPEDADFSDWPEVFGRCFNELCEDVEAGRRTVMDDYGATNEAEFFAVAVETFFEKADQLAEDYPNLYRLLRDFFATDPQDWA